MTTIVLNREDINNPLHPAMWELLCEELGVPTDSESLTLRVADVEAE